jgi:hypothetical protein
VTLFRRSNPPHPSRAHNSGYDHPPCERCPDPPGDWERLHWDRRAQLRAGPLLNALPTRVDLGEDPCVHPPPSNTQLAVAKPRATISLKFLSAVPITLPCDLHSIAFLRTSRARQSIANLRTARRSPGTRYVFS